MKIRNPFRNLTKFEFFLWITSLVVVSAGFLIQSDRDYLTLIASLVGVTALIFVAKGDAIGQILTVVFSLLYAVISYQFRYYGEMITYLGMTMPIAIAAVVTWIRHPSKASKSEVQVNHLSLRNIVVMLVLALGVTTVFYFILSAFNTPNIVFSTISITTSFLASYLTLFRSSYYALAYAANDVVLIALWVMATIASISYLPMVICFVMFLCNDLYGFFNWNRMKKVQASKA